MKQHDVVLARVRADFEDRVADLEQELADRVEAHAAAGDVTARAAAATAQQHDTALAAARAELEEAEAQHVKLEQDLALRAEAVRRETEAAHLAQVAALEAQAAERCAAAVSAAQAEAAQMLAETTKRHDDALARARAEARADVAQAEDQLAELKQKLADRVEAQAPPRDDAMRAAAETAQQRDAEVRAQARADVARAEERVVEVEQTLTAIRQEAGLARAEIERLQAERTDQREQASREARDQHERQLAAPAKKRTVTRRGMAEITGAVGLAGFAGTLIGWYVAFSGIL